MAPDSLVREVELLTELISIRGRQAELLACCQRAEANQPDVSPTVFARVMADYRRRLDAFDAEAMPLRLEAKAAYGVLQQSFSDIRSNQEHAASEREELLFRHKVGEFGTDVLDTRIQGPEQRLAECAAAMAALDERRSRFLEAFGTEADLDRFMGDPAPIPVPTPEPATPPPPTPSVPVEATPDATPADSPATVVPDRVSEPVTRALTPADLASQPGEADKTRLVPLDELIEPQTPEATTPLDVTIPPIPDAAEARTMILPSAVIIVRLNGEPDREFPVTPITSIGRSDHNAVCIPRRNVSREHAVIQATPTGFILKDHGSQNGTLVNGDAISECTLQDGDLVVIGDAQIEFKLTAPGTH